MSKHVLDVPYYRQIDLNNGMNSYWQNRSCGILALKMVIDFYRSQRRHEPTDLAEVFEKAIASGGTLANGDWLHSALVKTAQEYGFLSWRRRWQPADRDKDFFKNEGVNDASASAWEKQVESEALPSLVSAIDHGCPVVISAAKNFNEIDKNHDVVLTGYEMDGGKITGLYFNDPYNVADSDKKNQLVKLADFNWTYRAIFVEPKGK